MRVLFYGRLGERLGRSVEIALPPGAASVGAVRALLAERFPDAGGELMRPSLRASVGDALVGDAHPVADTDVIEFFPPVSGG
jgi:molybdopterin converting factor small subunit